MGDNDFADSPRRHVRAGRVEARAKFELLKSVEVSGTTAEWGAIKAGKNDRGRVSNADPPSQSGNMGYFNDVRLQFVNLDAANTPIIVVVSQNCRVGSICSKLNQDRRLAPIGWLEPSCRNLTGL